MLFQIVSFLLDVVAGLLSGACLLRLYMQWQHIGFRNPVGRFVFALTDWLVLPLRRVLPAIRRLDTATLVGAYLIQLAQYGILWLLVSRMNALAVPLIAVFGLLRLTISALMVLLIVYAVLSWVRADSPLADVIDRLAAPILRPFRRVIPLVGGFDLSPLAAIVVLQVGAIILANVQGGILR